MKSYKTERDPLFLGENVLQWWEKQLNVPLLSALCVCILNDIQCILNDSPGAGDHLAVAYPESLSKYCRCISLCEIHCHSEIKLL